ncbi:AcrR family transcriptional regulator [Pseudomonas sp. BIGb0408]|uniref:AcrR family transcriptional regulator n=1 Tax=Phytopseudomonas flavescens TaxID=29435 RepID=A0A7Z0BMZ0_9GAMM|nr:MULTISPECIES: hypothetical protein [Pseudomonas]MCW2293110.1 AcrR family transcriptional regulator [Pseudomonas sp. BIGb0408]NYH72320.1 AcrR family transcriptional regulator [Pseudomonas flavescens]
MRKSIGASEPLKTTVLVKALDPVEVAEQDDELEKVDRRSAIIELLVAHHLSGNTAKLKIQDVAERLGISRQTLHLYYRDLKPYISGKKDIGELVSGTAQRIQIEKQLVVNDTTAKWKTELQRVKQEHQRELQKALDSHITSLMNNDILMLESNQVRISLERQTLHNVELIKKITELELKLTQKSLLSNSSASHAQNKLAYDVDIQHLCGAYASNGNIDAFEDAKIAELGKIKQKLAKFSDEPDTHIIILLDKYISRFSIFAENYRSLSRETSLIVRLPLFTRDEITGFLGGLPKSAKKSIYIPYCSSDTERKAQRTFIYQQAPVPPDEVKAADRADIPLVAWGFDQVVHFKVQQGE